MNAFLWFLLVVGVVGFPLTGLIFVLCRLNKCSTHEDGLIAEFKKATEADKLREIRCALRDVHEAAADKMRHVMIFTLIPVLGTVAALCVSQVQAAGNAVPLFSWVLLGVAASSVILLGFIVRGLLRRD